MIVEAKSFNGRSWRPRELERRLVEALEVYRASRAYVVVPDGTKPRKTLSDPRIAVLTLSELARELRHVN